MSPFLTCRLKFCFVRHFKKSRKSVIVTLALKPFLNKNPRKILKQLATYNSKMLIENKQNNPQLVLVWY